jgi:aminoglycoside phosphotransferase
MMPREWETLRTRAVNLLAAAGRGDPLSQAVTRRQAEEVANNIAELLAMNVWFPTDCPEGHRLARQLAAVAGTEQDIADKLAPVSDE